jgi:protease I
MKKLQFVVHDFVDGFDTYTEKPGYTWPADVAFADVNPADYVALVIPGGGAPAGGALNGRRTAAYPALAPDVAAAGAEFVDSAAVVDGQMVSARAWPDRPAWMREFIQVLRPKAPAPA